MAVLVEDDQEQRRRKREDKKTEEEEIKDEGREIKREVWKAFKEVEGNGQRR